MFRANQCFEFDRAHFMSAGDQAETFLFRFMRASGVDGLAGMSEATVLEPGILVIMFKTL